MLNVIGQILCHIATNTISVQNCSEIIRLNEDNEEPTDLLKLLPEQILVRWLNYHLRNAGQLRVNNLGSNLKYCKPLIHIINQLDQSMCSLDGIEEPDNLKRAEIVLNSSYALGCGDIVSPKDLIAGNPKVNILFLAEMFTKKHGLKELSFQDSVVIHMLEDDI